MTQPSNILKAIFLFALFLLVHFLVDSVFFVQVSVGAALFVLFVTSPARAVKLEELPDEKYPPISVIVPMRNEEKNVVPCLSSLASLNYPRYEIIVANDSSVDGTRSAILEMQKKYSQKVNITLFDVPPLPGGWTGKTWALHNAVALAKRDIWLICDADVRHAPESLKHSMSYFLAQKPDMMCRTPWPITYTPGEWPMIFSMFTIRFSSWFSGSLLGQRETLPPEQYVIMNRKFYEDTGGYEAVRGFVPEVMALENISRRLKKKVTIMDDDSKEITVRMHEGAKATTDGIVRATDFRVFGFYPFLGVSLIISWAISAVYEILVGLISGDAAMLIQGVVSYALFSLVFAWYLRRSGHSAIIGLFAALLVVDILYLAFLAVLKKTFKRKVVWKGRAVFAA